MRLRTDPLRIDSLTRYECESGRHEFCPAVVPELPLGGDHPIFWICTCPCHRAPLGA
jgi:hypothetical protein